MEEWRTHVESGHWHKIDAFGLPKDDLEELKSLLKNKVPIAVRGHGVETFEGHIRLTEAESYEQYYAAELLQSVDRLLSMHDDTMSSLTKATQYALFEFEYQGFDYCGWNNTFLYLGENNYWVQLRGDIAEKVVEKRNFRQKQMLKNWENLSESEQREAVAADERWKRL